MTESDYKAPEGYRFPFPTSKDAYSFEDYSEDCDHLDGLAQTEVELRQVVNRYFCAHYPPDDRAQRCLNLFWAIESFLSRETIRSQGNKPQDFWPRFELGTRAAWDYFSRLPYGDVVTDDIAIVEVMKILQAKASE